MNVLCPESSALAYQALEELTLEEIEQQLESLPDEIVVSINKTKASAYVLNILAPLHRWVGKEHQGHPYSTPNVLKEMISEAVTLSLLRLLCIPSDNRSELYF
ncbi:hypothetical protein IQ236_26905 [Planktothrix mougeotii LEGE 06226]|uniref:Transposase n=2 Tax=Microcoleaceae TaxID=1892252 RepID=A0ABR9UK33_9CYAN|nr:hypothetical protein [Planktothrix sp. FACHB-1365]MBE9146829.1 hypothetical protein [Planktothrix mougeotii LEGE 06226]